MKKNLFIYAGQGIQTKFMGKKLYEENEKAREYFDEIFSALDYDLKKIMFEDNDLLNETSYTQPAITSLQIVLTKLLEDKNIVADLTAGHSLGEYGALFSAGALDAVSTVQLVSKRALYMQEANNKIQGSMLAVLGLDAAKISECIKDTNFSIANYNSPKQTIISGPLDELDSLVDLLNSKGARRCIKLNVKGAFHSKYMEEAAHKLSHDLALLDFNENFKPLLSNINGEEMTKSSALKEELHLSIVKAVQWIKIVEKIKNFKDIEIYEVGSNVLSSLIKQIDKTLEVKNILDI